MNQTKDPADFTLSELMIQHMMRSMGMEGLMYEWDQTKGPQNVAVSASFYSENMSQEEVALSGHLSQLIKEKGWNREDVNTTLLLRMVDNNLQMFKYEYEEE